MKAEQLAEAMAVTSTPARYEQTADEIGPGRSQAERMAARSARFTEWAEVILAHPAVAEPEGAGHRAAAAFLALAAAIGPVEGETPADTVRRHLGSYTPPDPDKLATARRILAERCLDGSTRLTPEQATRDLAEIVITLLGERATVWENGFQSGVAEGRKAASTLAMLEGAVFRLFDPRPLVAALAEYDHWRAGDPDGPDVGGPELADAVRQTLTDAGAPT